MNTKCLPKKVRPYRSRFGWLANRNSISKSSSPELAEHLRLKRAHEEYLKRMVRDQALTERTVSHALAVWHQAELAVGLVRYISRCLLPIPAAVALDEQTATYYWSAKDHQLHVEITDSGLCTWTYRNRKSGQGWQLEQQAIDPLTGQVRLVLQLISKASR